MLRSLLCMKKIDEQEVLVLDNLSAEEFKKEQEVSNATILIDESEHMLCLDVRKEACTAKTLMAIAQLMLIDEVTKEVSYTKSKAIEALGVAIGSITSLNDSTSENTPTKRGEDE